MAIEQHSSITLSVFFSVPQDGYVDWSKPLLEQAEELGDSYFEWVHQPVDRPVRLFHSDLGEMLTRAYWWMVPLTWCPVVMYMIGSSYSHLVNTPEVWPMDNLLGELNQLVVALKREGLRRDLGRALIFSLAIPGD
ncbi:fatty acid 2-hydroxylase [Elysia marginata]|uniref:Fatty acid 2-hydroxylase n=1 Tax=Elysia marginata TaxID=1093978 RepID=A0AAV4IBY2_9GAST|nr:fatty acid 2-hydroxylase [Elysia marginata]